MINPTVSLTVTPLLNASPSGPFVLNWSVTGATAKEYVIQRFIGTWPPDLTDNPANVESSAWDEFVTIATITNPATTTYTDNLDDLNLNGFTQDAVGRWVDSNGYAVIDQIFKTKRKIYYRILPVFEQVVFNSLPFLVLSYRSGQVTCRSTITQVKWNTLYEEGDLVWSINKAGADFIRTAVDPIWYETDRMGAVWVASRDATGKVCRLSLQDGSEYVEHQMGKDVRAIAVRPHNGNAWASGPSPYGAGFTPGYCWNLNKLSTYKDVAGYPVVSTTFSYGTNGPLGYTVRREAANNYNVYCSWDGRKVININVVPWGNRQATLIAEKNYGGVYVTGTGESLYADATNVTGIWTGADQSVWTSAYYTTRLSWETQHQDWRCYFGSHGAECDWYYYTVTHYTPVFLGDSGYVWGITSPVKPNAETTPIAGKHTKQFSWCARRPVKKFPCPDAPFPYTGQYPNYYHRGLVTDAPTTLDTSDTVNNRQYNIWQALEYENVIRKIVWDYSQDPMTNRLTNGSPSNYSTSDVIGLACDSENNIWGIGRASTTPHYKIYAGITSSGTTYPTQGNCRYPATAPEDWPDSIWNDKYIEYFLTRDPLVMSGAAATAYTALLTTGPTGYGLTVIGATLADKRDNVLNWINTYCYSAAHWPGGYRYGRKVYPNWVNPSSSSGYTTFVRQPNETVCLNFNSDCTGIAQIYAVGECIGGVTTVHPMYTYPSFVYGIDAVGSTPRNQDLSYWDDRLNESGYAVSGYDDMTIRLWVSAAPSTFELSGWTYIYGDKVQDIGCYGAYPNCGSNLVSSGPTFETAKTYKFHDPSLNGKPGNRWWTPAINIAGEAYVSTISGQANKNCYLLEGVSGLSGENPDDYWNKLIVLTTTDALSTTVWERWPTSNFYLTLSATSAASNPWNDYTRWRGEAEYSLGDNGYGLEDPRRIVSGGAPLTVVFNDHCIARTWPVSSWHWDFGDGVSAVSAVSDPTLKPRDSYTYLRSMGSHVYTTVGLFTATLFVESSCTGTRSEGEILTSGLIDLSATTVTASRQVLTIESPPWSNFIAISCPSLATVGSGYNDDPNIPISAFLSAGNPYVDWNLVSGYAPYLTVCLMASAVPHSLPISAYHWNFGDYYDEVNNTQTVTASQILTGFPIWATDEMYNVVTHRYTMPGYYTVTLCVEASTTATEACCAKNYQVYVEELPQTCGFTTSLSSNTGFRSVPVSGTSPLTVYFNPSSILPGSFPIGRIDWDFGDGSPVETITRWPTSVNGGLTAYPLDPFDPRNYIKSHIYRRETYNDDNTFTVRISTYTVNTNNVVACTGGFVGYEYNVGPILLPSDSTRNTRLIGSRMLNSDNDLYLVFEDGRNRQIQNVLLSSVGWGVSS